MDYNLALFDVDFCELLGEITVGLNSTIVTSDLIWQPAARCLTHFMGVYLRLTISLRRSNGMIEAVLEVKTEPSTRFIVKMKYGMLPFQELQSEWTTFTTTGRPFEYARVSICRYAMLANYFLARPENLEIYRPQLVGEIIISPVPTALSETYPIPRVNALECDYLLICDGREIWVHREYLVRASRFFSNQNQTNPRCRATNLDKLGERKRLTLEVLTGLLRFIYALPISNHDLQTATLLRAATEYEVNTLRAIMEDILIKELSNETAAELLFMAHWAGSKKLLKAAARYLFLKFDYIKATSAWDRAIITFPDFYRPIVHNPLKFFCKFMEQSYRLPSTKKASSAPALNLSDADYELSPTRRTRSSRITRRPTGLASLRMRSLESMPPTFSRSLTSQENLSASELDVATASGPTESDSSSSSISRSESDSSTSSISRSESDSSSLLSKSTSSTGDSERAAVAEAMDSFRDLNMTSPEVDCMNNLLPRVGNIPDDQIDASSLSASRPKSPPSLDFTYSYSSDSAEVKMVVSPSPSTHQDYLSSEQTETPTWPAADMHAQMERTVENPPNCPDTTHQGTLLGEQTEASFSPSSISTETSSKTWISSESGVTYASSSDSLIEEIRNLSLSENPISPIDSREDIPARHRENSMHSGRYTRSEIDSLHNIASLPEDENPSSPFNYLLRYTPDAGTLSDVSSILADRIPLESDSSNSSSSSRSIRGEHMTERRRREFEDTRNYAQWIAVGGFARDVYTEQSKVKPSKVANAPRKVYIRAGDLRSALNAVVVEKRPCKSISLSEAPELPVGCGVIRKGGVKESSDGTRPFSSTGSSGTIATPSKSPSSSEIRELPIGGGVIKKIIPKDGTGDKRSQSKRSKKPSKKRSKKPIYGGIMSSSSSGSSEFMTKPLKSDDTMPFSSTGSSGTLATSESLSSSELSPKRKYTEHSRLDDPSIERDRLFVDRSTLRLSHCDLQRRRNVQTITIPRVHHHIEQAENVLPQRIPRQTTIRQTITIPRVQHHIEQAENVLPQRIPRLPTIRLFARIDDADKSDDDNIKRETDDSYDDYV